MFFTMKRTILCALCGLLLSATHLLAGDNLISYSFPEQMPTSKTYEVAVGETEIPALQTERGAILSFGMTGPVELRVNLAKTPKNLVIRPLISGIQAKIEGDSFRLLLPKPMNLSVEVDGNLMDPLLIFANPKIAKPDPSNPKIKYFAGGKIHEVGEILLKDGETLFLEGGAVVRGVVRARGVTNVAVRGPGILDGGTRSNKINFLVLRECHNTTLEDFILLDPLGWSIHLSACRNVNMRNTRVVGWRANSDGLDIEYSSDVTVDGCFWRTNDDCIAIKAIYPPKVEGVPFEEMINPELLGGHEIERIPGDTMGNIQIKRCVLWNDSGGQGFEIGFELRIDEVRGIHFHDSDIIHVRGGGAFTIHNGDRARIHDLLIENIRVEDTERFIDFHVGLSIYSADCPLAYQRSNPDRIAPPNRPAHANNPWQWYIPKPEKLNEYEAQRGFVNGVTFKNINLLTAPTKNSILNGFSNVHTISKVRFENVVIAGASVTSTKEMGIHINEYVSDLNFSATKPVN